MLQNGGELEFLYSLVDGTIDCSFAAHTAAAAGLPNRVVERAKEVHLSVCLSVCLCVCLSVCLFLGSNVESFVWGMWSDCPNLQYDAFPVSGLRGAEEGGEPRERDFGGRGGKGGIVQADGRIGVSIRRLGL